MNSLNLHNSQLSISPNVRITFLKKDKLIARWIIEDNKLVCRWIIV
ncbi:hypothetical protein [Nostoc sp. FACHB-133]|nr:hypothetical protein [Nostoc sp. FACHB-133]